MENKESKSGDLSHLGKVYRISEVPKEKLRMTGWEQKILDARISKNALIQFPTEELMERFNYLLNSISAISGMPLPKNDVMGVIVKTELITFLLDFGYKLLNEDEILLAFRLNAQGMCRFGDGTFMPVIEPIGEGMNVLYVAKILSNYMILRNNFDSKLKNIIDGY